MSIHRKNKLHVYAAWKQCMVGDYPIAKFMVSSAILVRCGSTSTLWCYILHRLHTLALSNGGIFKIKVFSRNGQVDGANLQVL